MVWCIGKLCQHLRRYFSVSLGVQAAIHRAGLFHRGTVPKVNKQIAFLFLVPSYLFLTTPRIMRVVELVIDGFKSYAVRTVISGWDESFNSITGLNGSGKSNILDAICFVLGITSMSTVRAQNIQVNSSVLLRPFLSPQLISCQLLGFDLQTRPSWCH